VLVLTVLLAPKVKAQVSELSLGEVAQAYRSPRHAGRVITDDDLPHSAAPEATRPSVAADTLSSSDDRTAEAPTLPEQLTSETGSRVSLPEEKALQSLISATEQKVLEEKSPARRDSLQQILDSYRQRFEALQKQSQPGTKVGS
jgi:hypothetical protein